MEDQAWQWRIKPGKNIACIHEDFKNSGKGQKRFSRVIHDFWQQFWQKIDGFPPFPTLSTESTCVFFWPWPWSFPEQTGSYGPTQLGCHQRSGGLGSPSRTATFGNERITQGPQVVDTDDLWLEAVPGLYLNRSWQSRTPIPHDVHRKDWYVLFHGDEPDWFHCQIENCSQHQKRLPNGHVWTTSPCKLDWGSSRYCDQFLVGETNR